MYLLNELHRIQDEFWHCAVCQKFWHTALDSKWTSVIERPEKICHSWPKHVTFWHAVSVKQVWFLDLETLYFSKHVFVWSLSWFTVFSDNVYNCSDICCWMTTMSGSEESIKVTKEGWLWKRGTHLSSFYFICTLIMKFEVFHAFTVIFWTDFVQEN